MKYFLVALLLFFAVPASATTYYIDSALGSDANNGTAKGTPWAHAPDMANSTGTAAAHVSAPDDFFVFKGCSTWTNASFPITLSVSGTAGHPIIYGVDKTWFNTAVCPSQWNRPIFTGGGTPIGTTKNEFFDGTFRSYISLDNIEIIGFNWNTSYSTGLAGVGTFSSGAGNIIVTNFYIHGWTHTGGVTNDSFIAFYGDTNTPYGVGNLIDHTVFDGSDSTNGGDSGTFTYSWESVTNSVIHNGSNGVLCTGHAGSVAGNLIYNIAQSFDVSAHENGIECLIGGGTVLVHDNVIHDVFGESLMLGNPGETDKVWNNLIYEGATGNSTTVQFPQNGIAGVSVFYYNNTIVPLAGRSCINAFNATWTSFTFQNNHCITTGLFLSNSATVSGSITNTNNTLMTPTTATSQGYTSSQTFAYSPTAGGNSTVGAGTNLTSTATGALAGLQNDTTYGCNQQTVSTVVQSVCTARTANVRPSSSAWDSGAYEFVTSPSVLQVGPGQTYTTIQACLNAAVSGSTCNVHAATYTETDTFTANNVTLQVNPGDTVILDGTIDMLSFSGGIVDGFQITGFTASTGAVHAASTTGGIVRNNTVHDGTGCGIYVRLVTNFQIYNNTVHDMAGTTIFNGDGICTVSNNSTDATYAHGVQIYNNTVYQNHQDGIEITGNYQSVYNNYVHDNIYSDFASTHPDGIECNGIADGFTGCIHTLIYNNTVRNQNQNIYVQGNGTASQSMDCWIFNNVVFNDPTSTTGVSMATGTSSQILIGVGIGADILNNTIGGTVQFFDILIGDGSGSNNASDAWTNVTIENNIITNSLFVGMWTYPTSNIIQLDYDTYNNNSTALVHWGASGYLTSLASVQSTTGFETHGLSANPLINPFPTPILQAGSPDINAGVNLTSLGVAQLNKDIAGTARPSVGAWYVGAYQSSTGPIVYPPTNVRAVIAQ